MKLFFLRHGLAEDRLAWTGNDSLRPLTADGKKAMAKEAKSMAGLDLAIDLIITSPYTRCYQTAEIVARELEMMGKLVGDERLAPGFGTEELESILADHSATQTLLLVGHEPDLSEIISAITGGSSLEMKKGALAQVDLIDQAHLSGRLVWLIAPRFLKRPS